MPQYDVTGPDGKTYTVNAPDGASQDDAISYVQQTYYPGAAKGTAPGAAPAGTSAAKPDDRTILDKLADAASVISPAAMAAKWIIDPSKAKQDAIDTTAGLVRGAGSIGSTLLYGGDKLLNAWTGQSDNSLGDLVTGQNGAKQRDTQRRSDMDAALSQLGANTGSTAFGVGKLGAEVAGTAGLPVAAGRAVGLISKAPVVQGIADAISSGGMNIGPLSGQPAGGALSAVANAVRNGAIRTAGGAVAGGLTAGAVNPDDAGTGAAIGAVIPGGVQAMGALGQASNKVAAAVSGSSAEKNALNKISDALGDPSKVQQAIADIQTYYPKGAENIPVSAAGVTANPSLAQLEQASRLRSSPTWNDFDLKQAQAVADNVRKATQDADAIGQLKGDRKQAWDTGWDWAQQNMKPRVWTQRITQFYDDLGHAQQAAESSNPDVLNVLNQIQGEMDRLGPAFGPGNLQQMRANLSEGYNPTSSNPFKTAPRDSPAVQTIKQEMDSILNDSTGGRWQKVLDTYAGNSDAIRASDAARTVRNAYWDEDTGRVLGKARDAMGDVPSVTETNLGAAMNKARLPDGSMALSPEAGQQLGATLDALRRQAIVQNLKRSATAGGGSDTAANFAADAIAHSSHAPSLVIQLANAVRSMATGKTDAQMARLLSNPDDLAQGLGALSQAFSRAPAQPSLLYRAAPLLAAQGD